MPLIVRQLIPFPKEDSDSQSCPQGIQSNVDILGTGRLTLSSR